MINFLIGFMCGVYVGTRFDCAPLIDACGNLLARYVPEKKAAEKKATETKES